jgi:hypothetical protein
MQDMRSLQPEEGHRGHPLLVFRLASRGTAQSFLGTPLRALASGLNHLEGIWVLPPADCTLLDAIAVVDTKASPGKREASAVKVSESAGSKK